MPFSLADADYLYFVDHAVRGMAAIVEELGEQDACRRPDLPGANSPYGLVTHCLGVIEYWSGHVNAGRDVVRDRDREFTAVGTVAELATRVDDVLAEFARDVAACDPNAAPAAVPGQWALGPSQPLTQGGVLMHIYEEVAQHHGQLQVLRDALRPALPPFDPPLTWLRRKRGIKWQLPGPDQLPAWVADMDFPPAEPIRAAVQGLTDRGDLGYPDWTTDPLADVFAERMHTRFGWAADPAHVRYLADIIQAVQVILDLSTAPGDGVVAHLPNYPPFPHSITTMQRVLRPARLHPDGAGWRWHDDELAAAAADAKVLLLVNPHNPTGRAFTGPELERLAAVAERHDLLVVCDEIHAELVHDPHHHIPFATIAPERTVTLTSATKAYNIAGVRTAVAHVGPHWLRERWDAQPPDLYGQPSVFGIAATVAAWRDSDAWLGELRRHLRAQRDHLAARVAELPGIAMRIPEAGYLAWLDCRTAQLPQDPAEFFREHAGVYLSPGPDYDPDAIGWVRLNFATSRALLDEILDRMAAALAARA